MATISRPIARSIGPPDRPGPGSSGVQRRLRCAAMRSRRTCHAVPGSSERFLAKAPQLEADEVFLALEDAVAPNEKDAARARVIEALNSLTFTSTVVVRVSGTATPHYYRDLIDVVE